ncbi:hypothetical protein [Ascidiimonas sp. W6]|uniref:hypothetical protein n=1 Tax=Ascidiimonas meishanensis TaxID=3128903 RepID=UPI0030EB71C3
MKTKQITTKRILTSVYFLSLLLLCISCGIYPVVDTGGTPTAPKQKNITAAVTHTNGHIYFFSGNEYLKWNLAVGASKVRSLGVDGWKSLPNQFKSGIDASIVHPKNKNIYFFKGNKYCIWQPGKGLISRVKTLGVSGWKSLPQSFKSGIDAAVVHPTNKHIYFFKGNKYCKWKSGTGLVGSVRTIGVTGWKSLPKEFHANIDAAVVNPKNKHIYFFKGANYARWKPSGGIVKPGIRKRGEDGWKGLRFD